MILSQNPRLLSHLCLMARSTGSIEIRFHPDSTQVSLDNQHNAHLILTKRKYLLATILIIIYALQCIPHSNGTSVFAWITLLILVVGGTYMFEVRRKVIEIRDSINAVFQLDSILLNKSKKNIDFSFNKSKHCVYLCGITIRYCYTYCLCPWNSLDSSVQSDIGGILANPTMPLGRGKFLRRFPASAKCDAD